MPASGFQEWTGAKGHKQCYKIHPVNSAIALSGHYELSDFQGDIVPSFTIITLPHTREHIVDTVRNGIRLPRWTSFE
ncbi:hypothetical protein [Marinobacter sp.]|uniref:hypothetical protein n=1 Tax=Marinobacter sp. TaxID=50741 RepID=UPI003A8F1155